MKNIHASAILRTKLHRPLPTDDLIPRPFLMDELEDGRHLPLTLVSAPAGYGKSTLLSLWLEKYPDSCAWVSLDKHDNDLRLFLTYILESIQGRFPGSLPQTQALLEAANLPPLPELSRSLINECNLIDEFLVLVLDDYHLIENNSIHELISEFIQHPPRAMNLVLSVRRDPPLPLAGLRGKNRVKDIRVAQLRFSPAEIQEFLSNNLPVPLDDDTVGLLGERTEGWAAGLRLITLFFIQQKNIELLLKKLPANPLSISNFLLDEVLLKLDPAIQDFLMKTSILDRLSGPLCDAVAGLDEPVCDGQAYLRWLVEHNLFTISLDNEGEWCRYHHLFQQLLQRQLRTKLDKCRIDELHLKASRWFEENGSIDEAIHHTLAADDLSTAVRIIEKHRHKPLNEDKWYILEKWLRLLPDEMVEQSPLLLMAKAWVSIFQSSFWEIPAVLEKAGTILQNNTIEQQIEGENLFFQAILLFWEIRIEPSVDLFRRSLDLIPQENVGARNEAEIYLATASQMIGHGKSAIDEFRKKLFRESVEGTRKVRLLGALVFIHLLSGHLAEVEELVQQLEAMGTRLKNSYIVAWSLYIKGYVQYNRNNQSTASECFDRALRKKYLLEVNAPIDCFAGQMLANHALNQQHKVADTMNQLFEFSQLSANPIYIELSRSAQARLSLLQGDLEGAVSWLKTADVSFDSGPLLFWLEIPRITMCRVLAAQGTETALREANERLGELRHLCQATNNVPQMINILTLQALTFEKLGNDNAAQQALNLAVETALPGNWIRPFLEPGPEIAELLMKLNVEQEKQYFVRRILDAFTRDNLGIAGDLTEQTELMPVSKPVRPWADDMTNRELDVLYLLARRLSNKEIAHRLSISPGTVKRHTITIYQKLGVNSRRQAAQKALVLGIISPE